MTSELRTVRVTESVSLVSSKKDVRDRLIDIQRNLAIANNVVLDGRDIGTKVFPDAKLKLFITAKAEIRAERRYHELKKKGHDVNFNEILIKNGIKPSELGDECINELLQNAHEIASMLTKIDKSKYYSTEFMNSVKGKAFKAVEYKLGEKEFDKNDYLCEILARHKALKRVK